MSNAEDFVISGIELVRYTGAGGAVDVPAGIEVIRPLAFINTHITSVTLPDGLRHIGHHAFFGCQGLTQIVIPKSVMTIDSCAFMRCERLESVVIEGSLKSVGESTFCNTVFLENEYEKQNGLVILGDCVLGYSTPDECIEELVIPDGIVSIADEAFAYYFENEIFKRVVFPDSLYRIGNRSFAYMDSLKSISVCETISEFGEEAFLGCKNLEVVEPRKADPDMDWDDSTEPTFGKGFMDGTKWDEEQIFSFSSYEKPHLKATPDDRKYKGWSVEAIEALGDVAVLTRTRWEQLENEYRWRRRRKGRIEADRNVKTVVLAYTDAISWEFGPAIAAKYPNATRFEVLDEGEYVTIDGIIYSLRYMDNANTIMLVACPPGKKGHCQIPDGVTMICAEAFYGTKISSVTIPETVRCLDRGAFERCDKLSTLHIPKSVKTIDDQGYANPAINCKKLESITVDTDNKEYYSVDGILYHKYGGLLCFPAGKREAAVIPNSCGYIEGRAFSGCRHIQSLELPQSVKQIDSCAFTDAYGLQSIVIPDSVDELRGGTFWGCRKLKDVYFLAPKMKFNCLWEESNEFRYCLKTLCLHGLPGSGVEEYAKRNDFRFAQIGVETENE